MKKNESNPHPVNIITNCSAYRNKRQTKAINYLKPTSNFKIGLNVNKLYKHRNQIQSGHYQGQLGGLSNGFYNFVKCFVFQ
tara:strand:+ start:1286 stop:1528 length:243 start_codon:yes stop_codon:yes gene_type:complete